MIQCLFSLQRKCANTRPDLYLEIKENLIQFEDSVMRRVLKLKSTHCHFFAHDKKRDQHIKELQEIRDICSADFKNVTEGLQEFPSAESMLRLKAPSKRHMAAEENIMATTSLMFGEVTERIRALVAGIVSECLEMQGSPPCGYAVVGNHRFGAKSSSPFDPISLFLIIENVTAGTKAFFRNTLALLGMKIINLGETSLFSLNIRSLAWFADHIEPSGFSLANYIDDNEKKEFSMVPLDCIRTPKELTKMGVSDKRDIRLSIISLLQNMTFITGERLGINKIEILNYCRLIQLNRRYYQYYQSYSHGQLLFTLYLTNIHVLYGTPDLLRVTMLIHTHEY